MKRLSILVLAMVFLFTISPSTFAGMVESWGYDDNGQVSNTPIGNNFVSVTGGGTHSVAIKDDGSLVTWGDNFWGFP